MARKEEFITIVDGGEERLFRIRQMSALQQDRWVHRFMHLLAVAGVEMKTDGDDAAEMIGTLFYRLPPDEVDPLMMELLSCCAHVPDPAHRGFCTELTEGNIDAICADYKTVMALKMAALRLCFSFRDAPSPTGTTGAKITIPKPTRT